MIFPYKDTIVTTTPESTYSGWRGGEKVFDQQIIAENIYFEALLETPHIVNRGLHVDVHR